MPTLRLLILFVIIMTVSTAHAQIVGDSISKSDSTQHIRQVLDAMRQHPFDSSGARKAAIPADSGKSTIGAPVTPPSGTNPNAAGAPAGGPSSGTVGGPPSGMGGFGGMKMAIGRIYGKVIDNQKKPVSYASVSLRTFGKDSLIGGQLTEDNGDFSITDLPFGAYNLKINYLGYKDIVQKVMVVPNKMEQDLGNLVMSPDVTKLKEVVITGDNAMMEMKPDRKVFNVSKDISARGGTGLDVMKNIPSVSVDADGNVTLRNNSPQIYIDGKPTTLTLDQVPADQIERVEVITNPSAKFEAASSGGILNVILKRNNKPGYNGIVNMGIGTNSQYNGMAMLNLKQKKFGVSVMYTINGATNPTTGYTNRTTLDSATKTPTGYSFQNINSTQKRIFQVARVGLDFFINNRNTLSISENAVFGNFNTYEAQTFNIDSANKNLISKGTRDNSQLNHFRNFTTDVNFKHTYPTEGKEYVIDVQYNHTQGGGNYLYTTNMYDPSGTLLPNNPQIETTLGGQHADMITAQWDLSVPLKHNMKIETGVRSNYKLTYSNLTVKDFNYTDNSYDYNASLSNNYRIDDLVDAAYVTFSHQVKSFNYQLGLRAEQVYYRGMLLSNNDSSFSYQYPTTASSIPKILFPSINLSQKWGEKHELQINFSRKSNRPNFFQIAPFIFYSDNFNYRIGNPKLQPEFINQAEINYNLSLKKFSWLSAIYGKYTQQPITSFIYPLPSNPAIFINTFENGDHSVSGGWENTIRISAVKKLDIMLTGNVFYTQINGGSNENSASNSGFAWTGKAVISYKLPLDIMIQANGTYESPKIQPQGRTMPLYYFDLSLSKDISFVTINLAVSDVLNSKINGSHTFSDNYIQDQTRRRDVRFAKLGVSFKFGKMDASLFKSRKKQGPQQGGDDLGF